MTALHTYARKYVKAGWYIFPLKPFGKEPLTKSGHHDASNDLVQIDKWWREHPDANIGLDCGRSNIVVVDVDTKNGKVGDKSFYTIIDGDLDAIGTPLARTWSGGWHYFYQGDFPRTINAFKGDGLPDIDLCGKGGYVVLAPSVVKEGGKSGTYRWEHEEGDRPPFLPFPEIFRPKVAVDKQGAPLPKKPVDLSAPMTQGERNDDLYRRACRLRQERWDESTILGFLHTVNSLNPSCMLEAKELADLAHKACKHEPGTEKSRSATSLATALILPNGGEVMSDEDFFARCTLEVAWQIEGFVQCGGLMLLSALPKVGKSELARNMAKAVSGGEPFLGRRTKKGKVLWIGLAEPEQTLRAAIETAGLAGRGISWVTSRPAGTWQKWIASVVEQHRPDFAIVDEVGRLALDLESAYDYSQVIQTTQPFIDLRTKYGTTFVLLHHDKKTGGTMGSAAWDGAVDCIMSLARAQDGTRSISTMQRLGEDLEPTVLVRDPNTGGISCGLSKALAEQRKVEQRILDALAPGVQMTRQALADLAPQGSYVGRCAVDALLAAGLIDALGSGLKGDPRLYCAGVGRTSNASPGRAWARPEAFAAPEAEVLLGDKKGNPAENAVEITRTNPKQPEATRGITYHDDFRHRTYAEMSANGSTHGHAEVEVRVEASLLDGPTLDGELP
jgi:hypothetical protein